MNLINEIEELLEVARETANESHKLAMNSYGAGYDSGYKDGLQRALDILHGIYDINGGI